MAGIDEELAQILSARYGRDVRQSIHDAIKTCYDDGKATDVSELIEEVGKINNTLSYYEDKGFLSNNKYDKSNYIGIFVGTDGKLYSSNVIKSAYALLKPNTTYTIKKRKTSRYIVGIANGITTQSVGTFLQNNANITEYTFTTTSEYTYLIATVWHSTDDASISLNEVLDSVQINEGSEALPYTPYAPSNTELGDEVSRINENLTQEALDLKMLGWTVPSECPIQNTFRENNFIQKVGRIDLGSLTWTKGSTKFYATVSDKKSGELNIYCNAYNTKAADDNKTIKGNSENTYIYLVDNSYSDANALKSALQGTYAYYELATPIITTIDGNEAVSKINENLSELTISSHATLFTGTVLNPNTPYALSEPITNFKKITVVSTRGGSHTFDVDMWKINNAVGNFSLFFSNGTNAYMDVYQGNFQESNIFISSTYLAGWSGHSIVVYGWK